MALPSLSTDSGSSFPDFNDGNVVVVIAPHIHFKLHVDHLKRSAERFKKLFAEGVTQANQIEAVYGALSKSTSVDESPATPPPRKKAKKADITHYLILQGVDEGDLENHPGVLVPTVSIKTYFTL